MRKEIIMKVFSRVCLRFFSVLIAVVFLCSCSSRQWVKPGNHELETGVTVYRAVTVTGDTLSFAANSIQDVEENFITGQPVYQYNGSGGMLTDGEIAGVLTDGTETSVYLIDIDEYEIDKHNTVKTVLFTSGILAASGFLVYLVITVFTEDEHITPLECLSCTYSGN